LQGEVKLLSALGSSTQQAEVDDVVRQLREKHANDIASWQKIVFDLEGQLRTYKVRKFYISIIYVIAMTKENHLEKNL